MAKLFDLITKKLSHHNEDKISFDIKSEEKQLELERIVKDEISRAEQYIKEQLEKQRQDDEKKNKNKIEDSLSNSSVFITLDENPSREELIKNYDDEFEKYKNTLENEIYSYKPLKAKEYADFINYILNYNKYFKDEYVIDFDGDLEIKKLGIAYRDRINRYKKDLTDYNNIIEYFETAEKLTSEEYDKQIEPLVRIASRVKQMLKGGEPSLFRYSLLLEMVNLLNNCSEKALLSYMAENSLLMAKKYSFSLATYYLDSPFGQLYINSFPISIVELVKAKINPYIEYDKRMYDKTIVFENMLSNINIVDLKMDNYMRHFRRSIDQMPETKIEKIGNRFNIDNYLRKFIVLGIRVNGTYADESAITEISLIKYNELRPTEALNTLVNYADSQDLENTSQLAFYPTLNEISSEISHFIGDYPIVCFNVGNDIKYLYTNGITINYSERKYYDVLSLVRKMEYPCDCNNLYDYCKQYDVFYDKQGDLLHDTLATGELFLNVVTAIVNGKEYVESSVIYTPIEIVDGEGKSYKTNYVNDSLYDEAFEILHKNEYISEALLQRKLSIGTVRARKIIERFENIGFIKNEANKKKSIFYKDY